MIDDKAKAKLLKTIHLLEIYYFGSDNLGNIEEAMDTIRSLLPKKHQNGVYSFDKENMVVSLVDEKGKVLESWSKTKNGRRFSLAYDAFVNIVENGCDDGDFEGYLDREYDLDDVLV